MTEISQKELSENLLTGREIGAGLKLNLPRSLMSGTMGERLGAQVGSSLEFQDYRDYQPGDDLRRLDWAAYARSDKLTVRLYREEVQPKVDLLSDLSWSMLAPNSDKAAAAMQLAGLFTEASFQAETAVSWLGFGNGWQRLFNSVMAWPEGALPEFAGTSHLEEEFARKRPRLARRGIRICVSDFLWQVNPEASLRRLLADAASVILVCILTAEEVDPPVYGASSLTDAETAQKLDLQVSTVETNAYRQRLQTHLQLWRDAAVSSGSSFCQVNAEDILAGDIHPLLMSGILDNI